ncbi:MAG TPA: metal-dependent hydrolase [Polyangiaceae bacterium]|nr:metal-dependent hydrolase [Polyangiaceae bacterium]
MDNVTHSLAGMLVADAVCVWRRETRSEVRAAASLVSGLANNLPDIDIVYSWLGGPKPLGSLLHHRGHTHTLLVAIPMAWLLGIVVWHVFSRKNPSASPPTRKLLLGLALAGPLLHLLMDFGNNYGVHPFWPAYNGWLYGDAIFIVEPLWLAILIPSIAPTLTRRWLSILLWVVLVAVLLLSWFLPFMVTASRIAVLGAALAAALVARRASAQARVAFALGACVSVAALFSLGSWRAKAELRAAAVAAFPALTVHDLATAPLPANPACWEALLAGEQGGTYRVVRATVALAPLSPASCRAGADVQPTAPVTTLSRASYGGVRWLTEYRAEVTALSRLRRNDCRFHALLRFARLPYVSASGKIAGDLRYDRSPDLDFSDVVLERKRADEGCARLLPNWLEPRAELFRR